MADRRPVETRVERDDGVVFSLRGAGGGAALPHDLVHALVEQSLRMPDGIWGCIADGVVWRSMRHVSGRRPPHAAERSERLKKERAAAIGTAEAVADVVGRLVRKEPVMAGEAKASGHSVSALQGTADELVAAGRRWADLTPGATWVVEWIHRPGRRA
jgi:enoyl-CoA hydratase/carnithine racemase